MTDLWQETYRPKTLNDYLALNTYKEAIQRWWDPFEAYYKAVKNYKPGRGHNEPEKLTARPFLVLYGSPGCGKTTLAHCIYAKYGLDCIEINSSDARSKKMLTEHISTSKRSVSGDGNKYIGVIMDELDGLTSGDVGGVATLIELTVLTQQDGLVHARYPVICTTNSIKEKKLKPILDLAVVVEIKPPGPEQILKLAQRINKAEALGLTPGQLKLFAAAPLRDYRKCIDYLYRYSLDPASGFAMLIDSIHTVSPLAKYSNLAVQDCLTALIREPALKTAGEELDHLIESDSQLFFYTLLANCPQGDPIAAARFMSNYLATERLVTWTNVQQDWSLQDYINTVAVAANIRLLADSKAPPSACVYHTKYNIMRADLGYYNMNMVHMSSPTFNTALAHLTNDAELFLMAHEPPSLKCETFGVVLGCKRILDPTEHKPVVLQSARHTTNLTKKIKRGVTLDLH